MLSSPAHVVLASFTSVFLLLCTHQLLAHKNGHVAHLWKAVVWIDWDLTRQRALMNMHDVPLLHPLSGRQSPSTAASPAGLSHTAVSVGHLQSSLAITLSKLWSRFLCERRSDCSCIAARDLSFSSSEGPDSEVTHASTSVWAAGPVPAAGWFTSSKVR